MVQVGGAITALLRSERHRRRFDRKRVRTIASRAGGSRCEPGPALQEARRAFTLAGACRERGTCRHARQITNAGVDPAVFIPSSPRLHEIASNVPAPRWGSAAPLHWVRSARLDRRHSTARALLASWGLGRGLDAIAVHRRGRRSGTHARSNARSPRGRRWCSSARGHLPRGHPPAHPARCAGAEAAVMVSGETDDTRPAGASSWSSRQRRRGPAAQRTDAGQALARRTTVFSYSGRAYSSQLDSAARSARLVTSYATYQ